MADLNAGIQGLAIMMASRWKRPSATNTMASAAEATTGAVQPSTSPADRRPRLTTECLVLALMLACADRVHCAGSEPGHQACCGRCRQRNEHWNKLLGHAPGSGETWRQGLALWNCQTGEFSPQSLLGQLNG